MKTLKLRDKIEILMKDNSIGNLRYLSKLIGVPYTTLRGITNESEIKINTAKKICDYFKISLSELLDDRIDLLNDKDRKKVNELLYKKR